MTEEVYLNYISGKWQEGSLAQWVKNRNPAKTQDIIGKSTCSTAADVKTAIAAAELAQRQWAKTQRPLRGQLLARVATIMRSQIDIFATLITREEGKNLTEARGEVLKTINVLEFTASEGRRPTGQVIPSDMPNTFLYTTRAPLGVVGIITPWNFPLCIPAWKIGPALLEGNTVVFKPSSLTPASACLLVRTFEEAGVPSGVLNLVYGSGSEVGNTIVEDERVRGISFTGSNEVGKELNVRAARRLAHVQLEMGGKNPVIVLKDADLDQASDAIIQGAFGSTGQRCTATSRVIVEKPIHAELCARIVAKTRNIKMGDGLLDHTAMGPVIDEKQFKAVTDAIRLGIAEGAKLLCGFEDGLFGKRSEAGYFIAPTVFDQVLPEMELAQKEVFGPVLAIITVLDFAEAISVANKVEYGLSSSIYTSDVQRVMQYADQIETGIIHVNSPTIGGEAQAPFGGMKSTGLGGREMGSNGPEFFSEIKSVYIDYNSTVRQVNSY